MSNELKPPIILLGNTRSGTTIVQKVMGVHPDVAQWYEPRTLWLCADPGRSHDEFDECDATARVKQYIRKQFLKFQQQHGNRIVMEKTPANILKIPYVRAIFPEATFLFIVRNPFSFISSVEMKWQRPVTHVGIRRRLQSTPVTQLHYYAGRLIRDQIYKRVLGRKYLQVWGPRYKGIEQDLKREEMLTVIARQWALGSRKAERDLAQFEEGRVLRLRYEDFVVDPIPDLERICAHAGLTMTDAMVKAAKEWVKPDRQLKWQRFDPRDLARILPELEEEMQRHGYVVPDEIAEAIEKVRTEERTMSGNLQQHLVAQ
ncbi:MAG: sulfotransferase [Caldilineaceae bacterium]